MELRIVVLVGVAAATGWIGRGMATGSAAAPVANAAPVPAVAPRVVYVTSPARELPPDDDAPLVDAEPELDEGEDLGELLARLQREAVPPPPDLPRNLITGVVADLTSTERLAGVTVIATGPLIEGSRTAITNENGEFSLSDLPAGSYTVTFYYVDVTVERPGVTVSSFGHTTLNTQIETAADVRYVPVPTRTFESVLGSGDELGITFSGTTTLDDTYVVDGIDVTGM